MYRDERKLVKLEKVAKASIGNPNPGHTGGCCQVGSASAISVGAPNFRLERTSVSLISADPLSTASNGAGTSYASSCQDVAVLSGSIALRHLCNHASFCPFTFLEAHSRISH